MRNILTYVNILALITINSFFGYIVTSPHNECGMEETMNALRKSRSFFSGKPWPNARVPYEIDSSLRPSDIKTFQSAIDDFHQYTCVKFTPKTKKDKAYVTVRVNPTARKCGSAVFCYLEGYRSHFAEVASWCPHKWTWLHELSHTLCLGHEQGRSDRDEFLSFEECNDTSLISPIIKKQDLHGQIYDYNSVMHSSCDGGCWGKPKLSPAYIKHCGSEVSGQKQAGLSLIDIEKINEYYNCYDGCKRHRWYNAKNLTKSHMKSIVNLASHEGDDEPVYLCRTYIFGDISVGWYHPDTKTCQVSLQGKTFNVTEHVQIFTLPKGSNSITRDSNPYRLYSNLDSSNVNKYLPLGRTVENSYIFAATVEVEVKNGRSKTLVGRVSSNNLRFAYVPAFTDMALHAFRKFDVIGCSEN